MLPLLRRAVPLVAARSALQLQRLGQSGARRFNSVPSAPEKPYSAVGLLFVTAVVTPSVLLGGYISKQGAIMLEDLNIFVPDDDDDD